MEISSPKQVQLLIESLDAAGDAEGARSVCERYLAENANSTKPAVLDGVDFVLRKLIGLNEWQKVVSPRQYIDSISPLYDKLVRVLSSKDRHDEAIHEWTNKARAISEFDTDEALAVYDTILRFLSDQDASAGTYVYGVLESRFRATTLDHPQLIRNATDYSAAIIDRIASMYEDPEFESDPAADSDIWLFSQLLKVRDRLFEADATDEALAILKRALETLDKKHDPSFAHVVEKSIAQAYIRAENHRGGVEVLERLYFSQIAETFADIDDYEAFFDTAERIVQCHSELEEPRKALMFARDSIAFAIERLNDLEDISPLVSQLMLACHDLADELGYEKLALEYLSLLVRSYKDSDDDQVALLVNEASRWLQQ
jgi:tetratricopeptide (TPR) repeat protein